MTKREHTEWKRWCIKNAAKAVRMRDYLKAAELYQLAAFHAAVVATKVSEPS